MWDFGGQMRERNFYRMGKQGEDTATRGDKAADEVVHSTLLRRRWRKKRRRKIEREIAANCTLFLEIELAFCFASDFRYGANGGVTFPSPSSQLAWLESYFPAPAQS